MAGKRNPRTSKTDHVLSLLSGGAPEESVSPAQPEQAVSPEPAHPSPSPEEADPSASHPAPEKSKHTARSRKKSHSEQADQAHAQADIAPPPANREGERLAAPILQVARTNNDALSEAIRDALSQTLEEELAQQAPPPAEPVSVPLPELEPQPTPAPAPAPNNGKMSQEEIEQMLRDMAVPASKPEPEPQPEPPPAPAPAPTGGKMSQEEIEQMLRDMAAPASKPEPEPQPEPTPAPAPASALEEEPEVPFAPRETHLPDGSVCINVMEVLVDERLERYVHMFGLCSCPRCLADARALALTRLPAKYVVLPASAATPMVSLYRAKFESMVISQVIQACKTVMETPRHLL